MWFIQYKFMYLWSVIPIIIEGFIWVVWCKQLSIGDDTGLQPWWGGRSFHCTGVGTGYTLKTMCTDCIAKKGTIVIIFRICESHIKYLYLRLNKTRNRSKEYIVARSVSIRGKSASMRCNFGTTSNTPSSRRYVSNASWTCGQGHNYYALYSNYVKQRMLLLLWC